MSAYDKPVVDKDQQIQNLQNILFNLQQERYEDMKNFAHQFAKLATDLINVQLGLNVVKESEMEPLPFPPETEEDAAMSGGEIGA